MHLTPVTPFSAFPAAILVLGFRMYWFEGRLLPRKDVHFQAVLSILPQKTSTDETDHNNQIGSNWGTGQHNNREILPDHRAASLTKAIDRAAL